VNCFSFSSTLRRLLARRPSRANPPPPALFENFGEQHRDIGNKVPAAQRYFDQGRG
jgi:hypothetical protein